MSEQPSSSHYNAQTIIDTATTQLNNGESIRSAQTTFQSALLDWVDDITMGDAMELDEAQRVKMEIVKLWLAYADLNKRSKLYKSATEVYEQATNCPVAGGIGKIWSEYTQFLEERGRPRAAQKMYLRALVGDESTTGENDNPSNEEPRVQDPADRTLLWNAFLRMMQSLRKNPDLTMEDLQRAAIKERLGQVATVADGEGTAVQREGTPLPDQQVSTSTTLFELPTNVEEGSRPAKRSRWGRQSPVMEDVEVVNAGKIDADAGLLYATSINLPPEIQTLWLARDGGALPSRPEPPLFTASPPKLGDPSGKDLVGNDAALRILKLLTAKTHDGKSLGSAILDLCHACWMMTAIKEEEVTKAQESLTAKIIADKEALEADLEARASVGGGALAAVLQANEKERHVFDIQSEAQRQQLVVFVAWEFRKLLYTQQMMLTNAKIPGFEGPTVDSTAIAFQASVCSVMHSAFYLRARVGETSHVNMLNKQLENLEKVKSTTVKIETKEDQPLMQAPYQMQQPLMFQQPMMQPMFTQPPMMYAGQPQQQPMIFQTPMPMGYPPQMMQQGYPPIHPPHQQF